MKVRVILADDIRIEKGTDKPIVIGLYTDDQIVLKLPAEAPDLSRKSVVVLRLAILFSVAAGELPEGQHVVKFTVTGPDGKSLIKSEGLTVVGSKTVPANLILNLPNFPVVGFGSYDVALEFPEASRSHEYQFKVTKAIVADAVGSAVAGTGVPTQARATSKKRPPTRKKA